MKTIAMIFGVIFGGLVLAQIILFIYTAIKKK